MADDLYQAAGIDPQPDLYQATGGAGIGGDTSVSSRTNPFDTGVGKVAGPWLDFWHHASMGLSDKEIAGLQSIGLMPGGVKAGDLSDRYHKSLESLRGNLEEWEGANPAQGKTAKVAGFIAPLTVAGPEKEAASLGDAMLTAAKSGAKWGAAAGFGGTNDESALGDLEATGIGATGGAALGGAAPGVIGMAKAPFRLINRAGAAFTQPGAEEIAGNVLNHAANGKTPTFEPGPLPGMTPTAGQASNDPGLLWLERSVSQSSPAAAELSAKATAANNGAIHTAAGTLGNVNADASQGMSDALDKAYAARKAQNKALWQSADVSNAGGVSGFQFKNFMSNYITKLPVADQEIVPANVKTIMDKMAAAKTQNLSDVQSVRSMIGGLAAQASRSGDANTARVLNGMGDQVEAFIDMKAQNLGDKFPLYNQARANTRQMKLDFNTPPAVRQALGVDSFGADKIPVSATADHFINAGKGAPETFQSYLNAISTKAADGTVTYDPAGMQGARDAFAQKFLGTVTNAGVDQNGVRLVSPAKMQKFMDDYGHVISSPLFEQPQRDLMGRISQAAKMTARSQNSRPPGGGSDTFQKLQGDKFIDVLIGPGASKIAPTAAGLAGGIAGAHLEGPYAMMGGAAGAAAGANGLMNKLYAAPRDKVVQLVTAAMHDPDLAKGLMMKASNANLKLMPAPRRAKMLGILGGEAAGPLAQAVTPQ